MSTATDRTLHPWERRTLRCDRCSKLATQRMTASTWGDTTPEDGGWFAVTITARGSALACDDHYDEVEDALLEVHDIGKVERLRETWQQWLWRLSRRVWPLTLIAELQRLLNNYFCYRDQLVVSAALHGTPYPGYFVWRGFRGDERRGVPDEKVAKFRYVDPAGAEIDMETPA